MVQLFLSISTGVVVAVVVHAVVRCVSDRERRLRLLSGTRGAERRRTVRVTGRAQLVAQLEGALLMLSGLVGAGLHPAEGVRVLAGELPQPIQGVFADVWGKYEAGQPLVECLVEVGAQTNVAALSRLALAIDVCQVTGGDLVPVIEAIADRIGEDAELGRELAQRTAELKFTGRLLLVMPWVMLLLTMVVNEASVVSAVRDPMGRGMLLMALTVWCLGWYWMRQILNERRVLGGRSL